MKSELAQDIARLGAAPEEPARLPGGQLDWVNRITAACVGVFVYAIYHVTLSPDVSFWDSGEFIATSYSMGIPHPPGTPLYVLMGRFFTLFFHSFLGFASAAQAVNLLSAIPSAIAAVFLYLCVVRVGKQMWNAGDQSTFSFPATVAGVTAALFAAFANTLWINSIEAEVYAVSGMWAVLAAWLILVWADTEPKDERLLVLIAYLLSLNIGVHLATYLAALAILPFAFLYERRLAIPVSFAAILFLAKDLQFFLLVVALLLLPTLQFALLPPDYASRHRRVLLGFHAGAILCVIWAIVGLEPSFLRRVLMYVTPLGAFLLPLYGLNPPKRLQNPFTDLGFTLAFVTVLGFTCHLYLPIRSALDPAINEAQPDNWRAFWDVILRAQYRPGSVMDRQASWVFQADHMFWRYFREQWKPEFLWLLGIPGILVHLRRAPRSFLLFGLFFLWTSAALIVKMNFTDHEVRERDYFFAPGFFYFAVWMGLGLGWLADLVVSGVSAHWRKPAVVATALFCVLIAAAPIRSQWVSHDRRGNWIAYDYAYNMLVALDPNAILFTNGDNDTFPLWYLQEVEGFRKDVRIVNLSLLNTPWYGEQLKDYEPKVPITLTEEELWGMRPYRSEDGSIYLVKDQMTAHITNTVYREGKGRPVYFAVTVDDLMGLEPYLKLEGLVFRLYPDSTAVEDGRVRSSRPPSDSSEDGPIPDVVREIDLVKTRRNLEEIFQYRGLLTAQGELDPSVYRDDNEQKLVTNYAAAWTRMALAYRALGELEEAVKCMKQAVVIAPHFDPIAGGLGGMLIEAKKYEEAREFYLDRFATHPEDIRVYVGLAFLARQAEKDEEAVEWYLRGLEVEEDSREILRDLFQTYNDLGRLAEAGNVLERWLQLHPEDYSAKDLLEDVRRRHALAAGETPN